MSVYCKVIQDWKVISNIFTKVQNTFKGVAYGYVKVANQWKLFYQKNILRLNYIIYQDVIVHSIGFIRAGSSSTIQQEVLIYE